MLLLNEDQYLLLLKILSDVSKETTEPFTWSGVDRALKLLNYLEVMGYSYSTSTESDDFI